MLRVGIDISNAVLMPVYGPPAQPTAPVITGVPAISGPAVAGAILTAVPAPVTGTPAPIRTWAWRRSGTPIAGATTASYTLVGADVGQTITVVQTETNTQGSATAQSAATGPVAAAPASPSITGVPSITGTAQAGQTLTASPASASGTPSPTRSWAWRRSGTPIAGATTASYTLVGADVGQTITVVQTETNTQGSATAQSAATGPVAAAPPTLGTVTFTAGGAGTPASLALTYTGNVTGYRVHIATGTNPLAVSAAQLFAGAGGTNTLEFTDFAVGTSINVTGLTSASNSANRIAVCLINAGGSIASNVVVATVSGLDFTAPQLSAATTDATGALVTLTLTESVVGTAVPGNWSVLVNGTPRVPSAVSISGATVQLTLGTAATYGQTVTVSYSGGNLEDAAGNALAAISGAAVTNAVPSTAGFGPAAIFEQATSIQGGTGTVSQTTAAVFPGAGTRTWLVQIASMGSNTVNPAFTLSGPAIVSAVLLTSTVGVRTGRCGVYQYFVTTSGASDLTITETANVQSFNRQIVVQEAVGMTAAGAIVANASPGNTNPLGVSAAAVPAGRHVSAMAADRVGVVTNYAWSGSFAGSDEIFDAPTAASPNNSASAASKVAASTGTFTATITMTGTSFAYTVLSLVALDEV